MRTSARLLGLTAIGLLAPVASAQAYFVHTVTAGESLSSIAQADGLSVAQLAAANGLSLASGLVPGQSVSIPPQTSSIAPESNTVVTVGDGDADADDGYSSSSGSSSSSTTYTSSSVSRGGYLIQPGDTLWGLAARAGVSEASLAAANGLSPSAYLISGHTLSLTGSAAAPTTSVSVSYVPSSTAAAQEPVGTAAQGNPTGPPYPTPERLTASQVGTIGANNGATYSLTDAIGWEESGFNNDLVSAADARGIMQIPPGTWSWIQNSLAGGALAPASAVDNVRGGSLMLHWLLRQTGGDPAMAAAGYYQGLSSVQKHGMYRDTQQYVQNVLALRSRFGGG